LGQPLTITDLADELGLSATPIREALSRLAGEGLIEDRRGRGYFAPRLDVSDLAELYGLRRLYISEALAGWGQRKVDDVGDEDVAQADPSEAIVRLLDRVVAQAGSRALFDAYRQVCDRLAPVIRAEAQVFLLPDELEGLQAVVDDPDALGVMLTSLHESRQARVGDLVRAMRAGANIASL
jgi:DNA-binding transcriptional MocR family regulator